MCRMASQSLRIQENEYIKSFICIIIILYTFLICYTHFKMSSNVVCFILLSYKRENPHWIKCLLPGGVIFTLSFVVIEMSDFICRWQNIYMKNIGSASTFGKVNKKITKNFVGKLGKGRDLFSFSWFNHLHLENLVKIEFIYKILSF